MQITEAPTNIAKIIMNQLIYEGKAEQLPAVLAALSATSGNALARGLIFNAYLTPEEIPAETAEFMARARIDTSPAIYTEVQVALIVAIQSYLASVVGAQSVSNEL